MGCRGLLPPDTDDSPRVQRAAALPHSQKLWCLGFPADNKDGGWALPFCSSLTPSTLSDPPPPPLGLRVPSPATLAANGTQTPATKASLLSCPPSKQCPPVCPGKRLPWGRGRQPQGQRQLRGYGGRKSKQGRPAPTAPPQVLHGPHRCSAGRSGRVRQPGLLGGGGMSRTFHLSGLGPGAHEAEQESLQATFPPWPLFAPPHPEPTRPQ